MNVLEIIALLYLLIVTLLGYKRGFLKSVVYYIAVAAAVFLAGQCSNQLAKVITDKTDFDDVLKQVIEQSLNSEQTSEKSENEKKLNEGTKKNNSENKTNVSTKKSKGETEDKNSEIKKPKEKEMKQAADEESEDSMGSHDWQKHIIEESGYAKSIRQLLKSNSNSVFYDAMGVDSFYGYIADYISRIVINAVSYVLSFLGLWILFRMMARAILLVAELPVVSGVNRCLGAVVGLGKGFLVLFVLMIVITILCNTAFGKQIMSYINESQILLYLYENNPLLKMITDIKSQLF